MKITLPNYKTYLVCASYILLGLSLVLAGEITFKEFYTDPGLFAAAGGMTGRAAIQSL